MILLLPLLYLLSIVHAYVDPLYSPIVALLPRHLIAFYPLLSNAKDYAPAGTPNGYTQDGFTRSTLSITQEFGARLDRGTRVDFPVNIHQQTFPQLTIGAWVQAGQSVAVNSGTDQAQEGHCVWIVGVFDVDSTKLFVDGEMIQVNVVVKSVASQSVVVGAAVDQPLEGFTGYLKSVFAFDVVLSETELSYVMTTKRVPRKDTAPIPTPTPVVAPIQETEPKPHFYLKERLENTVNARQAIDPDADEYNVVLPTVDDTELLSIELVYADDVSSMPPSPIDPVPAPSPVEDPKPSRPWIFRLSPLQAFRSINLQVIDIFGMNFENLTSLCCSVDGLYTKAVFLSSSRIQCVIEPMRNDSKVLAMKIDVSTDGVDFSGDPKVLGLVDVPAIDNLSPDNGPTAGGTIVQIYGRGFVENVRYAIDYNQNTTDDVEYVSPSLLIWRTTGANYTGTTDLMLSVDDKMIPEISSIQFTFTPTPHLVSIFPQLLPLRSETVLTMSGSGFTNFVGLRCSFAMLTTDGNIPDTSTWTSVATFVSSSIVQCPAPQLINAGSYAVSISNNAQNFSPQSDAAHITVHNDILLENASVLAGPATGGTAVNITGQNLITSSAVACRFGESRSRAYFVSNTVIRCVSPAWNPVVVTDGIPPVSIQIALNGLDFSDSRLSFQYYAPPVVNTISPVNAPLNASLSLVLSGQYLVAFGGVVCRIGMTLQVPGTVISGGRVVECGTVQTTMNAGMVDVSVSLNGGHDFTQSQTSILVHEPIIILGVDTPYAAKNSNAPILVRGRGFLKGNNVKCVFGEWLTNGNVITSELMLCPLPSTIQSGHDYQLRISLNNGTHVSRDSSHVYVYGLPTFDSITPPTEGHDAAINVTGTGFVVNKTMALTLECIFGNYSPVIATVESDCTLSCVVPDAECNDDTAKTVAVNFQIGSSIVNTTLTYTYQPVGRFVPIHPGAVPGIMNLTFLNDSFDDPFNSSSGIPASDVIAPPLSSVLVNIFDISPRFVEKDSRVNITIQGQNFVKNTTFCYFGSQLEPIPAFVKSNAVASCAFDGSLAEPGSITLSLSLDRVRPSIATAAFAIVVTPAITSIYPGRGSLEGNTTVFVTGTGFIDNQALYCHFDQQPKVHATRLTDTMLECLTPLSRRGGYSKLRVSIDSSIYSSDNIQFLYQDMPQLVTMEPTFGSVDGRTTVLLQGRWLNASDDVVECEFGSSRVVDVVVVNATSVIVESPPSVIGTGNVRVKCSLNGEVLTPAEFFYHYLPTPYVSRITPQVGLASANTTILVDGADFSTNYPMVCHFGAVSSPTIVRSSSQLECVAPSGSTGIVNVSVTLGSSRVGDSSIAFEYIAEPILHQILPPLGSETGSTRLLIIGEGFAPNADMQCAFSREEKFPPVTTIALWASDHVVICFTPPFKPGLAHVQVAVGDNFASSTLLFNFTLEPRVFSVSPQRSSGAENAVVTIDGGGFVDSVLLRCSMGTKIVRPTRFESESRILCEFPRYLNSGVLPVRVTNNNQDFTTDLVFFTLYSPVVVDYATPLFGIVDEVTTQVDLAGHNVHMMSELQCQRNLGDIDYVPVKATSVSGSACTCALPTPMELYSLFSRPIPLAEFPNILQATGEQTVVIEEYVQMPPVRALVPSTPFEAEMSEVRGVIGNELTQSTFLSDTMLKYGLANLVEASDVVEDIDLSLPMVGPFAPDSLRVLDEGVWTLKPRHTSVRGSTPVFLSRVANDMPLELEAISGRFCSRHRFVCSNLIPTYLLEPNTLSWLPPRWTGPDLRGTVEFFRMKNASSLRTVPVATFTYRYYRELELTSITPSIGSIDGGTTVALSGVYFQDGPNLSCVLNGATFVPAQFVSDEMIRCVIPPFVSGPREIGVFVSVNGLETNEKFLSFTYVETPSVVSIFPGQGPITGSTKVTVVGTNFISTSSSVCNFGYRIVPAIVSSPTEAICIVQPSSWAIIGPTTVRFSLNGQEFSQQTVTYFFYENPSLVEVNPRAGSVTGGTMLTFSWRQVIPSDYFSNVSCQIGSVVIENVLTTDTSITIVVPASQNGDEGPTATSIALNGQNYVEAPSFWYLREPRIDSIYPNTSGEASSAWIRVSGTDFPRLSTLNCRFAALMTSAEWVSDSLVLCRAPVHRPGTVAFYFSINGMDMINPNLRFTFAPKEATVEFYPLSGPTSGGTELTIPVSVETQECRQLICIVDNVNVIGDITSGPALKCTMPPQDGIGYVSITVECDSRTILEFDKPFWYYIDPIILDAEPRSMSLSSGSMISVQGNDFPESDINCRFDADIVTIAIAVSGTEIRCVAPSFSSYPIFSYVSLEISANGVDFTSSGIKIQLTPALEVLEISPRHTVINQDLEVLISTSSLIINPELFSCRIGEAYEVPAFMASRMSIKCKLPAVSSPGQVTVSVSNNGVNFVGGSDTTLFYHSIPIVHSVSRTSGSVFGGEDVVINGLGFIAEMNTVCSFGNAVVGATYLNESSISCSVPPWQWLTQLTDDENVSNMTVSFTLGLDSDPSNITRFEQANALFWTYKFPMTDVTESPAMDFTGRPASDNAAPRAPVVSSTCPPGVQTRGIYPVSIACDGINVVASSPKVTYISPIWIAALQPSVVATSGGMMVEVKGAGFDRVNPVYCNFGRGRFTIMAQIPSSSSIRCLTPSTGPYTQILPLSLSTNASISNELLLSFEAPIAVIAAFPNVGFSRGGASVIVDVTSAPGTSELRCLFGDISVSARRVTPSQIKCTSPPHRPEPVKLRVEGSGTLTTIGAFVPFTFYPDIVIESVAPTRGTPAGGTQVIFSLSGSVNMSLLSWITCRFGSTSVEVISFSDSQLTCVSPLGRPNADVSMVIALNGQDVATSPVRFQYFALRELVSIEPRSGSLGGNVTLTALLEAIETGPEIAYACGFETLEEENIFFTAQITLSGDIRCQAPTIEFSTVRQIAVSIWQNGERYSANTLTFEIIITPTIDSVSPMTLAELREIPIRVTGTNFSPYQSFTCRFGVDEETPAWVISTTLLGCMSPRLLLGKYSFGISWNQQEYAISQELLTVYESLSVESIEPEAGFKNQQTEIRVLGAGFHPCTDLVCRFGETVMPATYVNRSEVRCYSPYLPTLSSRTLEGLDRQSVTVEVSLDGESFTGAAAAVFTYYAALHFDSIYPDSGSNSGGTRVLIRGLFYETLSYSCSFGGSDVPGLLLSSTLLSCSTPAVVISQRVRVEIVVLGISAGDSVPLWFTYFDPPMIISMSPTTFKTAGGEKLLVSGINFVSTSAMQCQFGDSLVSTATSVSSTTISCVVPPQRRAGYVAIEVTLNGVDYTTSHLSIYYYDFIDVLSVFPQEVSTFGGTELRVTLASESAITNTSIECIFVRSTGSLTRPAYVASSTKVTCFTPMWTPGIAGVGILVDGKQRYMADTLLAFITEPFIFSIEPDHGPTTGGTLITVSGQALDDMSIVCTFDEVEVTPSTITASTITCTTPAQLDWGANASVIAVSVTVGTSIRSNSVEFVYDLPIEIFNVSTQFVPEIGGTEVTVTGSNFLNTTELSCDIGAGIMVASFINSTMIKCPVGEARLSQVTIGVSNNGYDFIFFASLLSYEVSPFITAIRPTAGPLEGGTIVQLTMANADSLKNGIVKIFCSFGDQDTRGIMVDDDTVACISPAVTDPAVVSVSLYWRSFDLEDRFDAEKQVDIEFYYSVFPKLTNIAPSSGSAAEGTVVTLFGSGFRDNMIVRFDVGLNARYEPAYFVSAFIVTVEVPEQLVNGIISVAVSANEVDFSESLTFYVRPRPVLVSVYPSQLSISATEPSKALTIKGTGFSETAKETMRCRIGDDGTPTQVQWISEIQISCPAPYLETGIYSVYVALNGANFVNDGLKIMYRELFVVNRIEPAFGILGGNTKAQVFGSNFGGDTNETDLVCVFGTETSPLQGINASFAECFTPSQVKIGSVQFDVVRLVQITPEFKAQGGLTFYYHKVPTISKILPSMMRATTPSGIRLIGANFMDSPLLTCLVGGLLVPTSFVSSNIIDCLLSEVPNDQWLPESTLSIEVSNNGQDFSNSELQIMVQAPIRILRMEPSKGVIHQPVAVKIYGEQISSQYQNLKCHVGETQVVPATNLGDGWIGCELPASSYAKIVQVSVSIDSVYYTSDSLRFVYEDTPVVYSIYPTSGPFRGGTTVTVQGEGFGIPGTLHCFFGPSLVAARVISSRTGACLSPPLISGSDQFVSVAVVTFDGLTTAPVDVIEDSEVFFSYTELPQVLRLDPPMGVIGDQPLVTLETAGTSSFSDVWCKFGDVIVKADTSIAFVVESISCHAPVLPTGRYFVEVSTNEQDFSESFVEYTVVDPFVPTPSISPFGPPGNPDLRSLALPDAIPLSEAFRITDVFIDTLSQEEAKVIVVNSSLAPTDDATDDAKLETIALTLATPARGPMYAYQLYVTSIYPFSGDVNGGQLVDVVGGNFSAGQETILCRFGDTVTTATVLSASTARCAAPPLNPQLFGVSGVKVAVEVSLNGLDYSSSGVVYHYTPTPGVYSLAPNHGPLQGGTEIVVTGINFQNTSSLRCKFGDRVTAAATFLNSTQFTCVSPSGFNEGDVYVEIANHGLFGETDPAASMFTTSMKTFTYDPEIQFGSVFPSSGPTTGNFSVRITGGPFRKSDAVLCKFAEVAVVASWTSYDEILCMAPPHSPGVFTLEVTRNGQDYTDTRMPFTFYTEQGIRSISPTFGPAYAAGTRIDLDGVAFVNSSLLSCRFGYVVTPGEYVSPTKMRCTTPPLPSNSGGLIPAPLPEYRNQYADPNVGSIYLFPDAHYYPQYLTRLVSVEVSNNQQDFSLSGVNFLYYQDESVAAIAPTQAFDTEEPLTIFAYGHNFINTTALTCRLGLQTFSATFVTSKLLLCEVAHPMVYDDARRGSDKFHDLAQPRHALFEVSNNGKDFTNSHVVFEFLGACPTGFFCPKQLQGSNGKVPCPRGTYCPGVANTVFTLCPRGTYQPKTAQAACLRCPIGYHCPHTGMHVPRLCPSGFVCDVTGIEKADQPCPEGHYCLEGTATTATTCTPTTSYTGMLVASPSAAETPSTIRRQRGKAPLASIQARRSGCWRNETNDFGLQLSAYPSRFWMELRQLPLAPGSSFEGPNRGRYCLDDSCVKLADADNLRVDDEYFDYSSTDFALRRPVACPAGSYCHPGTTASDSLMKNFTTAQPCFESMYCPEGSSTPRGFGECAAGFYCPFGTRIPCPSGTYCPLTGHISPLPCPPGTFNGMTAQSNCTSCPEGFICPGFGRIMPALCPPGYVCSKTSLASPNSLCPRGFYCLEGTATSDGFRNDTRLRPYPCRPGTYCLKGVVADEVRVGDYQYPQNCTAGFYCELGSYSPKGSGLCPPGFFCPSGTAAPIPTSPGTFAQLEATVSAAECAPGYYAPTIESTECVPCPPGTMCEDDGTSVATICPPGSYRGSLSADGLACLACPQGTWSKNWEVRGVEECLECAPGTVCPIDGISNPCTVDDLPHVYTPVTANLTFAQCLESGSSYFFGVLLEPWIDEFGGGAHFLPDRDNGRCYENTQPRGSDLYQRFADFHGPLYEISTGTGVPHQGYGDEGQYPPPNMFARGSLAIDLPVSRAFDVARNCTPGFFYEKQWYPGTCEADIFCSASVWSKTTSADELVAQAQPCPEGYVCDSSTTADTAFSHLCPPGFVCAAGTTPDLTLDSPRGQLHELCPSGKYCAAGTAESQKENSICPAGYFCPTGTANPLLGELANDALQRRLSSDDSNPFLYMNYTKYVGEGDIRIVSAHDMRCFDGVDDDLIEIFRLRPDPNNAANHIVVNRAEERNELCARDHKWRTIELALRRNECDCVAQMKVVRRVFQLWKCTTTPSTATATVYDPKLFGWDQVHNSAIQCVFSGTNGSKPVNLTALVADGGSGVSFQTGWTETTVVHSYTELQALVEAKYTAQVVPVDPYVYDLHHAIGLIESFGEETPDFAGFKSGSSEDSEDDLIRLDACACSNMFKCPNATTSTAGAEDIYHCVKTGDEVLERVSPIPLTSDRLLNGSEFQDLTGVAGHGLGSIVLQPFEVAVVTINTTQLSRNLTYDAHYQISVYQDCKPCPPQYKCNLNDEPPSCTYPDDDNSTATRLYNNCLETYDGDEFICNNMPFFCERRTLPLAEISRDAANSGSNATTDIAGCCSCERQQMPYYFEDSDITDRGFPDNKHGYMQFSVAALEETEITIAVELVHGLYLRDFIEGFTQDCFDLTVFTPGRADYSPSTPSTNMFLAVIQEADMANLMLPLNLPEEYVRIAGTLTYKQQVASAVLIDRMSDLFVGDPQLPSKRGYIRNSEQNSIGELVTLNVTNGSGDGTDTGAVVVPPTDYFGLYSVPDPLETVLRSDSWWAQELDSSEFLALPYLPYFSSCRGFDSNIFLFKMLETHPDCTFVSYDQTVEVDQYPWRKKLTPNADRCMIEYTAEVAASSSLISSISSATSTLTSSSSSSASTTTYETFQRGVSLSCLYEENLEGGAEKLRWYEAPTGTTLFYITRDPTAANDFVAEGDSTTGTGWGRSDTLQNYLGTDALIPVKVGDNAGVALAVPQEVYLNLSYYQVTPGQKRMVEASVNFGKLCAVTRSAELLTTLAKKNIYPCTVSKATNQLASSGYTLQISWIPLDWFELMNLFQFTVDVYLGFFTLVAMASMILGFIVWIINRLFTKMKHPPKFRMKLLLKNVVSPPPIGIFMASVPIFVACLLIYTWWHVFASTDPINTPSAASFEATPGDWLDQTSLDKTRVENYKHGRVGLSLIVIGIYLLLLGSRLLVPETMDAKLEDNAYKEMSVENPSDPFSVEADKEEEGEEEEEEEEEEKEFWDPRAWKRANLLLVTVFFMAPMLVFWEFSYSPSFTEKIYGYLVLFKISRAVMEFVLEHFLHEKLLVLPFAVVLSASESMMAMGSADFIGFTMFYFMNLTLVMIEHLYTAPMLRHMRALWPKWRLSLQRRMRKRRRRTREQKAVEEAEWMRICERIDNQAAGVEAVLEAVAGYSVVFTELFIAPMLLAFQAFFSGDTRMPALYGVRQTDLLYYALYSLFIIPSNFVLGALQLNTMELAHGWKLYEYSAYQRHRFSTRETRWPLAHTPPDESIHPSCQSLDLLCFSSQLYFLLVVYAAGILLTMFGISVCLRVSYSYSGDQITLIVVALVYHMMWALEVTCVRLGDKLKVWKPRKLTDGTLDEDLAAKLALGAGRQRELERERLELQALNSERFRHRFLERNRPWVLQHLAELFTPRTLQATDGPAGDGRPNSEYVRDLYHELVNMGEGRRLKGDRSDISDDDEDDLEKMRRAWSNVPVEGASRDLALYWLARARKRRTFAKLVAGIIAASRQSECCVCGKREDGGYTLQVDLAATEGAKEHDPRALDRLIDGFENELGTQEMDADLWKAYFRKHAAYATLCNVCLTAKKQTLSDQANKLAAGMRKLRADEFSSDEGSDEEGGDVPFAPIVVARGSIEGRVLSKWLLAARKRLGGAFPRPEAEEEMERYARKLKRSRRRAGKKDHVDSDEEGKDPMRHWRLELNEAARALALRWIWEARDLRDAAARNLAAELREKLQALNDQIVEADDWYFGQELREAGLALRDDGEHLAEEQARVDEDLALNIRVTERDVEGFAEEKKSINAVEESAFAELIAKEREDTKARVSTRELELLEAYKQKETEFVAAQRQAREAGELTPALISEHRTYLAKMAEDRKTELETMEEAARAKTQQKEDAFARKLALADAAVTSRRALAQHRVLALKKEARGVVRARESAWQSKARSWIDRASRKVQVKQQEDAEAQLNDKRRRKRVLLAT